MLLFNKIEHPQVPNKSETRNKWAVHAKFTPLVIRALALITSVSISIINCKWWNWKEDQAYDQLKIVQHSTIYFYFGPNILYEGFRGRRIHQDPGNCLTTPNCMTTTSIWSEPAKGRYWISRIFSHFCCTNFTPSIQFGKFVKYSCRKRNNFWCF